MLSKDMWMTLSCNPQLAEVLKLSIVIVTDMRAISVAEDDDFKQMMQTFIQATTLHPKSILPNWSKYEIVISDIKDALHLKRN